VRVKLLARPDHSVALYEGLRDLGVDVDFRTFYAFRKGSLAHRLLPSRKSVPSSANTALLFTFLGYAIARARIGVAHLNWRQLEQQLARFLVSPGSFDDVEIVHYWPLFFAEHVRVAKARRPDLVTLADFYFAEPKEANELYAAAYAEAGLSFASPTSELIDQTAAFASETQFVVPSEFVKQSYLRRFPRATIHVVPYGLMGKRVVLKPRSARKLRWAFVGEVCVEKGVHRLFDAMALVPELTVDLIGRIKDGQEDYVRSRLATAPNVRSLGQLPNVEVLERLPTYDGFVLPSLSDAYSIAAIEALAAGLPVVVTDRCGIDTDVRRYRLGAVATANDAESLAHEMRRIAFELDDAAFENGLREFERDQQAHSYARGMADLYERLTSHGVSSRPRIETHGQVR
jgi:glycosyltransferase involved in cell wall biosynthesis